MAKKLPDQEVSMGQKLNSLYISCHRINIVKYDTTIDVDSERHLARLSTEYCEGGHCIKIEAKQRTLEMAIDEAYRLMLGFKELVEQMP